MANRKASDKANSSIAQKAARSLRGWIFYAERNGRALAEAGSGSARRKQVDGLAVRPYDASTIVHVASISKLICGIAVLRFIEDWNEIADQLQGRGDGETSNGPRKYKGAPRVGDDGLIASVEHWDGHIALDNRIYPFLKPHLNWIQLDGGLLPRPPKVTGLGVGEITIRELLTHTSGLRDAYYDKGLKLLGMTKNVIKEEVTPSGKAKFNLVQDCAVVLASDLVSKENAYCNDGFTLLGALIEFCSGVRYEDWVRNKLTFDARFHDIARHPIDMTRAARYYAEGDGAVAGAVHPDYADFSACGGFYTSPKAICDWLDAIMQKEVFNVRPLLKAPELLLQFTGGNGPGDDRLGFGPLSGFAKNGGTSVSGGSTNARVCYLKGYGNERATAFFQTNQPCDADGMLIAGLNGIREFIYPPSGVVWSVPELVSHPGLRGIVWKPAAGNALTATALRLAPAVQVQGGAQRTNLLAGAGAGFNPAEQQTVELTGILTLPAGQYRLRLTSDDGALLFLDDDLVIDNDKDHGFVSIDSATPESFAVGREIKIIWYNSAAGPGGLYLESILQSTGAVAPIAATCFRTKPVQLQPPPTP